MFEQGEAHPAAIMAAVLVQQLPRILQGPPLETRCLDDLAFLLAPLVPQIISKTNLTNLDWFGGLRFRFGPLFFLPQPSNAAGWENMFWGSNHGDQQLLG